jgi:hypothetical protein
MRQVPEYDLSNPSTWTIIEKRDVLSESEEKEIQDELIRIADLNPQGEPNLVLRWAVTYLDPMLFDNLPKYFISSGSPVLVGHEYMDSGRMVTVGKLEEVPANKISLPVYSTTHLGERKFIVERWRSPEFLKRTGRFQQIRDDGTVYRYFACRNCGERVPTPEGTNDSDIERICPLCDSKRVSPVDYREEGDGRLMRELPREGCYDFFMRLETPEGFYRPPDSEALKAVAQEWHRQQKSAARRQKEAADYRQQASDRLRQARRGVWHPDNLLRKTA